MKAQRLEGSPTLYSVTSERLVCTVGTCGWSTTAQYKWQAGDGCPHCTSGRLERGRYQVDLSTFKAIGSCGCDSFQFQKLPELRLFSDTQLDAMSTAERSARYCKHVVVARAAAGQGANLDALLMALTQQGQEQTP